MIRSTILQWLDGARETVPEVRADVADESPYRMDSAINYATGLGGSSDKGASVRPNVGTYDLSEGELTALWRFGGLSRRIVKIIPSHATRKGWAFKIDDEEVLADESTAQDLVTAITNAWTWGRLYGGGFIVMVTGDEEDMSEELISPVEIKKLLVYDGTQVSPVSWGRTRSEYAGRPETYMVSPHNSPGQIIHASRILYIRGALLPPNVRGTTVSQHDDSVLQALWDSLAQKDTSDSARALIMQEMSVAVLSMAPGAKISTGKDAAALTLRMRALAKGRSLLGTVLLAPGEEYKMISRTLTGLGEVDEAGRTAICAATGYPEVILFGKAPAGMSSDDASSRRTWAAILGSELDTIVKPVLIKWAKTQLGTDVSVAVEFAPIDEPTPKEAAETRKLNADSDVAYIDAQVLSSDHVAQSRFGGEAYSHEIDTIDMADLQDGETLAELDEARKLLEGDT